MPSAYLTLSEAAALAGMSTESVLELCRAGLIVARYEEGRWRIAAGPFRVWSSDADETADPRGAPREGSPPYQSIKKTLSQAAMETSSSALLQTMSDEEFAERCCELTDRFGVGMSELYARAVWERGDKPAPSFAAELVEWTRFVLSEWLTALAQVPGANQRLARIGGLLRAQHSGWPAWLEERRSDNVIKTLFGSARALVDRANVDGSPDGGNTSDTRFWLSVYCSLGIASSEMGITDPFSVV